MKEHFKLFMRTFKAFFQLIRPQQWIKNGFIFLPIFFHRDLLNPDKIILAIVAFFSFSFAASSIYCLNDIKDVESDRRHFKKCARPLASGAISKSTGYIIMLWLLVFSVCVEFLWRGEFWWQTLCVIGFYYLMNIAYCLKLKQIAIVDVFILSFGFVLRVVAGGVATNTPMSHWIILIAFLLALFLAFAKRRDDVLLYDDSGIKMRSNIVKFNIEFINAAMVIVATMTMVCYVMYTISEEIIKRFNTQYLYLTSFFVLLGVMRYLQLTLVEGRSGDPTRIAMSDIFIQLSIAIWAISFFLVIYFL